MRTHRWPWFVGLLLVAILGVGACSKSSNNPYQPAPGGGGGGVTKELNSPDIAPSLTYQHTFSASIATITSFPYHCKFHGAMTGSVTVDPASANTAVTVTIVSSTGPFPGATVKPGGTVTWINNDTMTHSVTSN